MRLQLQEITQRVLAEKEQTHKKLVEEHLNQICLEAANNGSYEAEVTFGCLSDGKPFTGIEVEEFANSFENPLTYTPPKDKKCATLSWYHDLPTLKS